MIVSDDAIKMHFTPIRVTEKLDMGYKVTDSETDPKTGVRTINKVDLLEGSISEKDAREDAKFNECILHHRITELDENNKVKR